ncbi:MAG: CBU_0592 family membrane protein [Gammaproteobacteria bacterium]
MIPEILGVIGVLMVIAAFFLLVSERLSEIHPAYLGSNILGSALILVSLAHHFNLAATLMQAAWIVVTIAGAFLHRRAKR